MGNHKYKEIRKRTRKKKEQDCNYKYKEMRGRKRKEKEGKLQDCNYKYKETKRGRFNPVSRLVVDNDLLVCQILSRLPVKSLMRFKCVSKGWKSMIEEDSFFINLHLTHSQARPGLFSFLPTSFAGEDDQTRDYEYLILADLSFNGKPAKIHTLRKTKSFSHCKILGPINGLVCFVKHSAVRIYNVSTREATPWIKSRVCIREEKRNVTLLRIDEPGCYFGFDPTTRKHKALFVWCEGKFKDFPVCEVLTVGDNTWRIINEVQPCIPSGMLHTYANGSIYWYLYHLSLNRVGEEIIQFSNESIMAFDIGSEKFRVIPVPEFTISNVEYGGIDILEVDGCLAILRWNCTWGNAIVKLWKFHDHNNAYGISSTRRDNWTQEKSITLPSYMLNSMFFIHSAGKDQLILETYRDHGYESRPRYDRNVMLSKFYSYNRDKNTLQEFKIDGISDIPVGWTSDKTVCTTFVESLLRVR